MRSNILALSLLLTLTSAHPSDSSPPFAPAIFHEIYLSSDSNKTAAEAGPVTSAAGLLARDGACPANYNQCSTEAGACCGTASYCSNDGNNIVACCASGATCTGTANYGAGATGLVSTFTTTSSGIIVVATTTLPATSVTGNTATTASPTGSASYISNSLFGVFPIYPTSFPNAAACTSAYSACASNYKVCTDDLQGTVAGFGVTVNAPNGAGVTVGAPSTTVGVDVATSVCGSLSSKACPGTSGTCGTFGTSGATSNGGSFVAGNHVARVTAGPGGGAALLVGAGIGMGMGLL